MSHLLYAQAATLSEALDRANEDLKCWKEKFAVQGLQLSNRIKLLRVEVQSQQSERVEMQSRIDEQERRADQSSSGDVRRLMEEVARLQARAETLEAERGALRNALTVADEDRARLDQRCAATRQELGERAASLERTVDRLERDKLVRCLQHFAARCRDRTDYGWQDLEERFSAADRKISTAQELAQQAIAERSEMEAELRTLRWAAPGAEADRRAREAAERRAAELTAANGRLRADLQQERRRHHRDAAAEAARWRGRLGAVVARCEARAPA